MTQIWMNLSSEQFAPSDLLRQGIEGERAGFDAVGCSDHFQPWWPEGESGHAWTVLAALAQATERVPVGTGVTAPMFRYHPVLVAQAFMTLEEMFPGRVFLGIGSGEALNEVPFGIEWPRVGAQIRRMEEALEIITRLWDGERLDFEGEHFTTIGAHLYSRARTRPKLYVSAFGPKAVGVAGRWADGVWTLGDPDAVPRIIETFRATAAEAGRAPGEIILQCGFSWAADDERAMAGARVWKGTLPREFYVDDWHDPAAIQKHVSDVPDDAYRAANAVGADPQVHVDKIEQLIELGATVVALQNQSGADPHGAIATYGREVLPRVRERAGAAR
jgi:coenzyme F420-dependent glucose-6-phosphate dehydrogenase